MLVLVGHKVLTWYFSQKKEKKERGERVGTVVAPLSEEKESDRCGICTGRLKNPTMVRHTGYVYCWECISDYVRKERRCPLGGLEASPDNLQVLYS